MRTIEPKQRDRRVRMADASLHRDASSRLEHIRFAGDVEDARWQLVQRILASPALKRSTLLANFFLFVCVREIEGRSAEITEKQIGVHVFGRTERYNANDDNIVRSYARTLRKRLEEYFSTTGSHEELVVAIPRGGYVPTFTKRNRSPLVKNEHKASKVAFLPASDGTALPSVAGDASFANPSTPAEEHSPRQPAIEETCSLPPDIAPPSHAIAPQEDPSPAFHSEVSSTTATAPLWRRWGVLGCLLLVAALAGYMAAMGGPLHWLRQQLPAARLNHAFWASVFEGTRDTFIVPADGGLVMLQSFTKQHVSLEDYANGNFRKESWIAHEVAELSRSSNQEDSQRVLEKIETIGNRRYTSIADLELTTHLSLRPEAVPSRLLIRYARDLRVDDLRNANAILIGSIAANPWVDLFQQSLNFRFRQGAEFGGSGVIINQHPLAGEHPTYASEPNDPLLRTYGVIAYVPNLSGNGHVVLIEGVNMAGTQAAGEFLLDQDEMEPVLKSARGKDGRLRPFEILVETDNIAANASRPHLLSERIAP